MDPTEEIIRKEIAEARRILREDRVLAKLNKHFPDEPVTDPKDGPPPPDPKDPPEPVVKKGIWWGEQNGSLSRAGN